MDSDRARVSSVHTRGMLVVLTGTPESYGSTLVEWGEARSLQIGAILWSSNSPSVFTDALARLGLGAPQELPSIPA